jgi:hypothetical protein
MSSINLSGNASGSGTFTIASPNSNTSYTLSLPEEAGTITTSNSPYSTFRNRIINGDMRIDQRNAGASVTINQTANIYVMDRWRCRGESSDGAFTCQQDSDVPSGQGFKNSAKITVTTADASIGASQIYGFQQLLEGFNISDLDWGTAAAKTVTLSFWVRSSLTGTFSGALSNGGLDRSYPFTYTISSANTWEQKTITIVGDTTGTWPSTNATGMRLSFSLGSGSNFLGTAGAWNANNNAGATGETAVIGTLNATWYITGVQLEVGSVATPFERRPYGQELQLCQRYFQSFTNANETQQVGFMAMSYSSNTIYMPVTFIQEMRALPTVLSGGTWYTRRNNLNTFTANFGFQRESNINCVLSQGGAGGQSAGVSFWVEASEQACQLEFNAEL